MIRGLRLNILKRSRKEYICVVHIPIFREWDKWFCYRVGLIENFVEFLVQYTPVILQTTQKQFSLRQNVGYVVTRCFRHVVVHCICNNIGNLELELCSGVGNIYNLCWFSIAKWKSVFLMHLHPWSIAFGKSKHISRYLTHLLEVN